MSDMAARVRHDETDRPGRIVELDGCYRAVVDWDDGNPDPVWVPRRHLIILDRPAVTAVSCRHGWPGSTCGSAHPYIAEPTDLTRR